ncbi:NAD-dependent epimerase/dehydratase family protein [Candidatus Poriferisocius sp.]|uniref:NAD-dependent epimerase/dehydratase family protein n=1 Tax=Candidatus Poriferisocius sp. TaxID=3101276 RepID=UPI003B019DFF
MVAGAGGPLGHRVCRRLVDHPRVGTVVGLDLRADPGIAGVDYVSGDITEIDLDTRLGEVDVLVHLVSALEPWPDGAPDGASDGEVTRTRRVRPPAGAARAPDGASDGEVTRTLLEAAGSAGVGRLVLMSTAMVYGAWPDNPVPLTEASPLRPVPGFSFAVNKAEQERFAARWAEDHPAVDIVTLRPTTSLAEDHVGWVARSLRSATNLTREGEVPVQFLHLDDLAAAVELAVVGDLSGVYNVAPEGWISSGTTLDLEGLTPRVRLPEQLLGRLSMWWWRHRPNVGGAAVESPTLLGRLSGRHSLVPTCPSVFQYARFPWVVGSDRLRAAGWTPQYTSDLAYISGHKGHRWGMLDSRRRQQLALGVAVAGVLGLLWGFLAVARRLLR